MAAGREKSLRRTLAQLGLGALVVGGAAMMLLDASGDPRVERAKQAAAEKAAPALEVAAGPVRFFSGLFARSRTAFSITAENARLRAEVETLRSWRDYAMRVQQENERLRGLNNVRPPLRVLSVVGQVIADSADQATQTALVSVGSADGVHEGSAALSGDGLIGRVLAVGERSSRLLLLTDTRSRIPVRVEPAGHRALLAGDGGDQPKLVFMQQNVRLNHGDRVVTSGDGGVLPRGVEVGVVAAGAGGEPRVQLKAATSGMEFVRILRQHADLEINPTAGVIFGAPGGGGLSFGGRREQDSDAPVAPPLPQAAAPAPAPPAANRPPQSAAAASPRPPAPASSPTGAVPAPILQQAPLIQQAPVPAQPTSPPPVYSVAQPPAVPPPAAPPPAPPPIYAPALPARSGPPIYDPGGPLIFPPPAAGEPTPGVRLDPPTVWP
ncbi:rod shape-determining protein MreC [Neomegalonema perideroedes]|uniref:rod shape-determining protein MreC n=1 Tax=Neomegalonema perideroedes TaxID=217219 RepID=UPI00037DF440|nr:rod shape-determining protein MreC [Neomegalonema perideroedes]